MKISNFLTTACVLAFAARLAAADDFQIPPKSMAVLEQHCYTCHDEDISKGDINLDHLFELPLEGRLALLNKMQEQIYLQDMPPKDEKDQPVAAERRELYNWVRSELAKHDASTLEEKMTYHGYGNYINHDRLFSGTIKAPAYTPARRWLVSPQIFMERVRVAFQLEGRNRNQNLYGITNPFVLPERSGIRDWDNTTLDGGHLLVMLSNAQWIAEKQILAAKYQGQNANQIEFPNPKDRWLPPNPPGIFVSIVQNGSTPADGEIEDAIRSQFDHVLQREPTGDELRNYLELTKGAVEVGGNEDGLKQMLITVLLESEFLYRQEMGGGPTDQHGRTKLTPREAAYAISYALGDRNPDPQLMEAAESGKLASKEDFQREVTRLLEDPDYFRGKIDPSLEGKQTRSLEVSHPKTIRFFRDFFGYPGAMRVFKDSPRSGGYYSNPDRGDTQTPGRLVSEADRIVAWYVEKDNDVFENLLTTEEFFVYQEKDTETGQKIIDSWKSVWEKLKDTDWKTDPGKVYAEQEDYLKSVKEVNVRTGGQFKDGADFRTYMAFFEEYFGKGITPYTSVPWQHGYNIHHSPSYNLPPTPSIGRYYEVNKPNFKGYDDVEFWDYPLVQPFKIPNRKGILTHPAWLIAHSQNAETDPVKRGRWIREMLLAGHVPDVPITVDAQIPEDHHKTLRDRLELVTRKEECWRCHQEMNPLGLAFEIYDDFGRFRTQEGLEHPENLLPDAKDQNSASAYKSLPVNAVGELSGTNDPALDGEVTDALDMIDRLAKSEIVRQSIIRHAFRFYIGRNEMLTDSQTLVDADNAYVESGGSFKAVILSLLTSDSFIYRK